MRIASPLASLKLRFQAEPSSGQTVGVHAGLQCTDSRSVEKVCT